MAQKTASAECQLIKSIKSPKYPVLKTCHTLGLVQWGDKEPGFCLKNADFQAIFRTSIKNLSFTVKI